MVKTKLIIGGLEVVRFFSNIFAGLGALCSFSLLIKTDFIVNEQGKSALIVNGLFYKILFFSLLPTIVYVLLGYVIKWLMKNEFKIIQKSVFNNRPTVSFLLISHYTIIIFTFIGVCIAHTNYIWLISIPALLFIYLLDIVTMVSLSLLKD